MTVQLAQTIYGTFDPSHDQEYLFGLHTTNPEKRNFPPATRAYSGMEMRWLDAMLYLGFSTIALFPLAVAAIGWHA